MNWLEIETVSVESVGDAAGALAIAGVSTAANRVVLSVVDGQSPFDLEGSRDLVTWEKLLTGVTGEEASVEIPDDRDRPFYLRLVRE